MTLSGLAPSTTLALMRSASASSTVLSVRLAFKHVGGCQNYDPFLGTLNIRCRIIIGNQTGTIILTTAQVIPKLGRLFCSL